MALDCVALNLSVAGKPIDYIDEADWGLPLEKIYSQNMHRIFCVVQVPRSWLPLLKTWMAPVGYSKILGPMGEPLPDPLKYRDRAVVCDLAEIGRAVSIPDLQAKVQSTTDVVPLINGLELSPELFRDARLFSPNGKILDLNGISDGPCSIGAAQTYATWALFGSDVINLTGGKAIVATQQTATTETAQCAINIALGGGSITMTSAVNLLGNFGAGYLTTTSGLGNATAFFEITCSSASAGAKINISNLNIKMLSTPDYGYLIQFSSNTLNITNNVSDCLLNGNGKGCLGAIRVGNVGNSVLKAFNCVCASNYAAQSYAAGVYFYGGHASSMLENITCYGFNGITQMGGLFNYPNLAITLKNVACFYNSKDYTYSSSFLSGLGNAVASKCASSDTSGSEAGLRSLVAANQFQSLTLADGDPFLKLKAGSALLGAGVAPSIAANTYGIRGNARPHGGLYSIGADEWKLGGDYHRIMRGMGRGIMRGAR